MKVTINRLERMSLEDFADQHGLDLIIDECVIGYKACFKLPEDALFSPYYPKSGWGESPTAAVVDFANQISSQFIAITGSRTVKVPKLHVEGVYE